MKAIQQMVEKAGSQALLAEKINQCCVIVGVKSRVEQHLVSKWARGVRQPGPVFIEPLCRVSVDLGMNFDRSDFRPDLFEERSAAG